MTPVEVIGIVYTAYLVAGAFLGPLLVELINHIHI